MITIMILYQTTSLHWKYNKVYIQYTQYVQCIFKTIKYDFRLI